MSYYVVRMVKNATKEALPGPPRQILEAWAWYCDDDGDGCYPAKETIAEDTGRSVRYVQKQTAWLVVEGFMTVVMEGGGRGNTTLHSINTGRLLLHQRKGAQLTGFPHKDAVSLASKGAHRAGFDAADDEKGARLTGFPPSDNVPPPEKGAHRAGFSGERVHGVQGLRQPLRQNGEQCAPKGLSSSTINDPPTTPPYSPPPSFLPKPSDKQLRQEFEEVWNGYPRKLGKQKALKGFVKARKTGTTVAQFQEATARYVAWLEASDQFAMHGGTFYGSPDLRWQDFLDETEVRRMIAEVKAKAVDRGRGRGQDHDPRGGRESMDLSKFWDAFGGEPAAS